MKEHQETDQVLHSASVQIRRRLGQFWTRRDPPVGGNQRRHRAAERHALPRQIAHGSAAGIHGLRPEAAFDEDRAGASQRRTLHLIAGEDEIKPASSVAPFEFLESLLQALRMRGDDERPRGYIPGGQA